VVEEEEEKDMIFPWDLTRMHQTPVQGGVMFPQEIVYRKREVFGRGKTSNSACEDHPNKNSR
jgi:hypothetical protein